MTYDTPGEKNKTEMMMNVYCHQNSGMLESFNPFWASGVVRWWLGGANKKESRNPTGLGVYSWI